MLLAELDDGTLLAPGVELDLVDSGSLISVNELLEVLDTAIITKQHVLVSTIFIRIELVLKKGNHLLVANADGNDLAFGLKLLERLPQVLASLRSRSGSVDQEAIHITYHPQISSLCQQLHLSNNTCTSGQKG